MGIGTTIALIKAFGGSGGGGSGGGVLVVTDTDGTLNKTWQEIHDADFAVVTWEDATDKYTRPVSSLYADDGDYGVIVSAPTGTTEYLATAASGYPEMQGGGGGQAHFAQAGGKNPEGVKAAIDKVFEIIG